MASQTMEAAVTAKAQSNPKQQRYTVEMTPSRDGDYGYILEPREGSEAVEGEPPHGRWSFQLKRKNRDELFLRMNDALDDDVRCRPFKVEILGRKLDKFVNPFVVSKEQMPLAEGSWGSMTEEGVFESGSYSAPTSTGKPKIYSCLRLSAVPASANNQGLRTVRFEVKVPGYKTDDPEMDVEC